MKIIIEIGPSKTCSWLGAQVKRAKSSIQTLPAKSKSGLSRVNQFRRNSVARLRRQSAVS